MVIDAVRNKLNRISSRVLGGEPSEICFWIDFVEKIEHILNL